MLNDICVSKQSSLVHARLWVCMLPRHFLNQFNLVKFKFKFKTFYSRKYTDIRWTIMRLKPMRVYLPHYFMDCYYIANILTSAKRAWCTERKHKPDIHSMNGTSTVIIETSYIVLFLVILSFMMTSSNGNIFRVTGHLCGEFTGPRWIPHTKASDAVLWCLLWSAPE